MVKINTALKTLTDNSNRLNVSKSKIKPDIEAMEPAEVATFNIISDRSKNEVVRKQFNTNLSLFDDLAMSRYFLAALSSTKWGRLTYDKTKTKALKTKFTEDMDRVMGVISAYCGAAKAATVTTSSEQAEIGKDEALVIKLLNLQYFSDIVEDNMEYNKIQGNMSDPLQSLIVRKKSLLRKQEMLASEKAAVTS